MSTKVDLKNQIYNSITSCQDWKVYLAKEIILIKNNDLEVECLDVVELDEILHHILT